MSAFSTNQAFKSREELTEWVQKIARGLGYVIVTKRSKARPSGYVSKVILMCDRGGVYKSVKDTSRSTGTRKTNCPFELKAKYNKEDDNWTLSVNCNDHNHPPAQHLEGHPFAKRLLKNEVEQVAELTQKHVAPRDILGILKGKNKNNFSTLKTIYNERSKIREKAYEGKNPMQVLISHLQKNGYTYIMDTNTVSNELEALFFVHSKSIEFFRAFPHVLLMDTTYKTNKFNLPFLQIVGTTSTNKTFSIAFAFMHDETVKSYLWALRCLKATMDECMQPRAIVTDRELALMSACKEVFPKATQILCRWHISRAILRKCRPSIKLQHDWNAFQSKWKAVIKSQTLTSFEEKYAQLKSMLSKYQGVLNYLDEFWINKYKEMFVSVWIDQCLHYGNRTTSRVESEHSKLKLYLHSSNSSLDKFLGYIDEIMISQDSEIKASFEMSRINIKHEHNIPVLELLHGLVSQRALTKIHKQIQRIPSNCGCQDRKCYGLPCACEVSVYLNTGQSIPLDSIDIFWRKLDMSPLTHDENDDINCEAELKIFKKIFDNQSKPGRKFLVQKLRGLCDPSIEVVEEPTVKKNTRGRPNLKKQQQKARADPVAQHSCKRSCSTTSKVFEYNFMDLKPSPPRDSSHTSTSNSDPLMKEIPDVFHPYITRMQNVNPDGNCGFRSIAVCLGESEDKWPEIRQELLEELHQKEDQYRDVFVEDYRSLDESLYFVGTGFAPERNWMIMPDTGILIANRFGVIVHYLSKQGSSTCFPLWKGHEEYEDHRAVTIAHVHGCHYIMVQLEGEYPMPTVLPLWKHNKHPSTVGWQSMYMQRLQKYTQLVPGFI